ncbi:DUF6207 family protein [Streptomyces sp. NPDC059909]|uniref:DUF6207 family protein n=1 Tax=Streptomyces sp. NPDC059909 TaxID=3346998 RepID=UPI00364F9992
MCALAVNRPDAGRLVRVMDRIDEQHGSEPGLVVLNVTAHDEATAIVAISQLVQSRADAGTAEPGGSFWPGSGIASRHITNRKPWFQVCSA